MTNEEHWEEMREEYLSKTAAILSFREESIELGEIVEQWDLITNNSDHQYLWRSLEELNRNQFLEVTGKGSKKMFDLKEKLRPENVPQLEEVEFSKKVKEHKKEAENLNWGVNSLPRIPAFVFLEHLQRYNYDVKIFESINIEGVTGIQRESNDGKSSRLTLINDYERERDRINLHQWLKELDAESSVELEDLFTDRNRESYIQNKWDREVLTLIQRSERVAEAAERAVEEYLPRIKEIYNSNDRYSIEPDSEFEALKWNLRFSAGERYSEEAENYIEGAIDKMLSGESKGSSVFEPFMMEIESTPLYKGDMPIGETQGETKKSEKMRERYETWMSHYLDLVWQKAEERYAAAGI